MAHQSHIRSAAQRCIMRCRGAEIISPEGQKEKGKMKWSKEIEEGIFAARQAEIDRLRCERKGLIAKLYDDGNNNFAALESTLSQIERINKTIAIIRSQNLI